MAEARAPLVQRWITAISAYEKDFKKWEGRVERILKRYRDDTRISTNNSAKFNILWSNVQTIVPAVFARLPKPDVSRRFKDNDPVGRVAALILERALDFEIEHYPDYRAAMKNSVLDRFLGGRGVAWARYEPHISATDGQPVDGVQVTEDADEAESQVLEVVEYECAPTDYVHWKNFLHGPGRCWEEVPWVGREVYMRRPALIERFGEELGNKIPLDTKPDEQKRMNVETGDYEACIYEIWDKESGEAIWLSKSFPELLDSRPDPLGLEGFFPCPRPLYATLTTDSLVPVPDFTLYQDQANTLDVLCDRIDGLVHALQVKGCFDASVPELKRLFTEGGNGDMIPVNNWSAFAEKKGLDGAISLVELQPIYEALSAAYQAMEQQKAQIYEITGLSDIVRGQGDAQETATAQKLKGQYASLRLKAMQGDVSQYAAELLQLKAQIICGKFEVSTIAQMAAVQQFSEQDKPHVQAALALLKNSTLSDFRIEVSSDPLVQVDEEAEQQAATELVTAVGTFLKDAAMAPKESVPFLSEMLKWVFSRYKAGKSLEGAVDEFADQMKQKAMQPAPPPPPDPTIQKQEMIEQGKQQAQQADQAHERQKFQAETQVEAQRAAMEQQAQERQAEREAMLEQMRQQAETMRQESEQRFQMMLQQSQQQFELLMQRLEAKKEIELADKAQDTTLATAQLSAETAKETAKERPDAA